MDCFNRLTELFSTFKLLQPPDPQFGLIAYGDQPLDSLVSNSFTGDFYIIALNRIKPYEFLNNSALYTPSRVFLFFSRPGNLVRINGHDLLENSVILFFEKEYLAGNDLYCGIDKLGFFDDNNESFNLSLEDEAIISNLFHNIKSEYEHQDEHSKGIILSFLSSILKYCERFHKYQFMTKKKS